MRQHKLHEGVVMGWKIPEEPMNLGCGPKQAHTPPGETAIAAGLASKQHHLSVWLEGVVWVLSRRLP
jgi:hypothetical protein